MNFASPGTGPKFTYATTRVRMTAFKPRSDTSGQRCIARVQTERDRARRRLNSRNHAGGYPLSRPEAFKFLFAALCKRARAADAQRRRALVDISPGGSSKAARGGAQARPARRARPGGTARAPWRARRRRRRGNGPRQRRPGRLVPAQKINTGLARRAAAPPRPKLIPVEEIS